MLHGGVLNMVARSLEKDGPSDALGRHFGCCWFLLTLVLGQDMYKKKTDVHECYQIHQTLDPLGYNIVYNY